MATRTLYITRDIEGAGAQSCDSCQHLDKGNDRCGLFDAGLKVDWSDPRAGHQSYTRDAECVESESSATRGIA